MHSGRVRSVRDYVAPGRVRCRAATNSLTLSRYHTTSGSLPNVRMAPGFGAHPSAIAAQSCRVVSKSNKAATMSALSSNGQLPDGGYRAGLLVTWIVRLRIAGRSSWTFPLVVPSSSVELWNKPVAARRERRGRRTSTSGFDISSEDMNVDRFFSISD